MIGKLTLRFLIVLFLANVKFFAVDDVGDYTRELFKVFNNNKYDPRGFLEKVNKELIKGEGFTKYREATLAEETLILGMFCTGLGKFIVDGVSPPNLPKSATSGLENNLKVFHAKNEIMKSFGIKEIKEKFFEVITSDQLIIVHDAKKIEIIDPYKSMNTMKLKPIPTGYYDEKETSKLSSSTKLVPGGKEWKEELAKYSTKAFGGDNLTLVDLNTRINNMINNASNADIAKALKKNLEELELGQELITIPPSSLIIRGDVNTFITNFKKDWKERQKTKSVAPSMLKKEEPKYVGKTVFKPSVQPVPGGPEWRQELGNFESAFNDENQNTIKKLFGEINKNKDSEFKKKATNTLNDFQENGKKTELNQDGSNNELITSINSFMAAFEGHWQEIQKVKPMVNSMAKEEEPKYVEKTVFKPSVQPVPGGPEWRQKLDDFESVFNDENQNTIKKLVNVINSNKNSEFKKKATAILELFQKNGKKAELNQDGSNNELITSINSFMAAFEGYWQEIQKVKPMVNSMMKKEAPKYEYYEPKILEIKFNDTEKKLHKTALTDINKKLIEKDLDQLVGLSMPGRRNIDGIVHFLASGWWAADSGFIRSDEVYSQENRQRVVSYQILTATGFAAFRTLWQKELALNQGKHGWFDLSAPKFVEKNETVIEEIEQRRKRIMNLQKQEKEKNISIAEQLELKKLQQSAANDNRTTVMTNLLTCFRPITQKKNETSAIKYQVTNQEQLNYLTNQIEQFMKTDLPVYSTVVYHSNGNFDTAHYYALIIDKGNKVLSVVNSSAVINGHWKGFSSAYLNGVEDIENLTKTQQTMDTDLHYALGFFDAIRKKIPAIEKFTVNVADTGVQLGQTSCGLWSAIMAKAAADMGDYRAYIAVTNALEQGELNSYEDLDPKNLAKFLDLNFNEKTDHNYRMLDRKLKENESSWLKTAQFELAMAEALYDKVGKYDFLNNPEKFGKFLISK